MTDITERLRLRNDPSQMLMCYPPRPAPDMLCYEAAAEIERLRAALLKISELEPEGPLGNDCMAVSYASETARAALAGEKANDD